VGATVIALGLIFAPFTLRAVVFIAVSIGVPSVLPWATPRFFRYPRQEAEYTTLLMSTGLTSGSISAHFGLTHGVIDQAQYSYLIAAVIGGAVLPTLVANALFLPRYLLPKPGSADGGTP
jgi:Kef-type K+ transport system membrane component KefB